MSRESFIQWLNKNTSLSASTIGKYTRAVTTVSYEFLIDTNLYNLTAYQEAYSVINNLLKLNVFQEKNSRGHNMYSNALKKYLEYLKQNYE